MSRITIKEQERVRFNSFDATENVVLVPLMTTNSEEAAGLPTLYENLRDFTAVVSSAPKASESSDAEVDNSYYFICELLNQGLKVLVKRWLYDASGATSVESQLTQAIRGTEATSESAAVPGIFNEVADKNLYNVKFITAGGYAQANFDTKATLVDIAADRGDCVAVIDLPPGWTPANVLNNSDSQFTSVGNKYMYSTIVWPSCYFNLSEFASSSAEAELLKNIEMPASLAYLAAFGSSVQVNADWFAVSGVIRGNIPDMVKPKFEIGERLMHILQGDSPVSGTTYLKVRINPIMDAGVYGHRIWGNRTANSLSSNDAQSLRFRDFLNVRILLCDIKKQIYHAAMRNTFEPNDDITWVNFKKICNTLLDQMQSGRGIRWYSWRRVDPEQRATIKAVLTIQPIEAVEYFDITINLTDEEVNFEEELELV